MLKEVWKILAVGGLLALGFALVWMNRYEYQPVGNHLVRIDRLTGQACNFHVGPVDKDQGETYVVGHDSGAVPPDPYSCH